MSTLPKRINQNGKTTLQRLEIFIKTLRSPLNTESYIESIILKNEVIVTLWNNLGTSKINKMDNLLIAERVEVPLHLKSTVYKDFDLVKYIMDGNKYQVREATWNNKGNKIFIVLKLNEEKPDKSEHREIIGKLLVYHSVNAKNTHEGTIKFYRSSRCT
ncbi:8852_t:CDS:2 [Acaulospora morrowiae]|uniref:8852_t:CDS:1 n=1 Tax=Acaulospora morrowiae TaxID=94023 RepID=A0A9N8YUA6_9GLOM|nr:8852_t:CDS:2 [Acaulospora morrowiae]